MAAATYAGDILPGHPPIPIDRARGRARGGILLGVIGIVAAVVLGLVARARAHPGLVVDVAGAVLVAAGVALTWGQGPGLIAAGLGVLALSSYGDTAPGEG